MFAGLIFVPNLIVAAILFYMAYADLLIYFKWLGIFPLSLGIGTYIIRDGLNEWWAVKHPRSLFSVLSTT